MSAAGIQRSQGSSQSNDTRPNPRKKGRHPKRATRVPPNSSPKLGLSASPAARMELARPRRLSRQCVAKIFEYPGYATFAQSNANEQQSQQGVNLTGEGGRTRPHEESRCKNPLHIVVIDQPSREELAAGICPEKGR